MTAKTHIKNKTILLKFFIFLLIQSFIFAGPSCVYSDISTGENNFIDKAALSPQLHIDSFSFLRNFVFYLRSDQTIEQIGYNLPPEVLEVDTAMVSLENAVFIENEQKELKAELTGLRTGGLGRYIGDLLARKNDIKKKVMGIGLLYDVVNVQEIDEKGRQIIREVRIDREELQARGVLIPVLDMHGKQITIDVEITKRYKVPAKLWLTKRTTETGQVYTLLLDNKDITSMLYIGESTSAERLEQSILLGKGGIKALEALKIRPKSLHLNEGGAALIAVYAKKSKSLTDVNVSGVMHTPIEAGLPTYDKNLFDKYFFDLGKGWREVIVDSSNTFIDLTQVLFEMSAYVAAVSEEFSDVLKNIIAARYPSKANKYNEKVVPITNGVDGWAYQHPSLREKEITKQMQATGKHRGDIIYNRKKEIKEQSLSGILRKQLIWYALAENWPEIIRPLNSKLRERQYPRELMKEQIVLIIKEIVDEIENIILEDADKKISKEQVIRVLDKFGLLPPGGLDLNETIDKLASIEDIINDIINNKLMLSYGRRFTKYKMDYPLLEATGIERLVKSREEGGLDYAVVIAGIAHPNDAVGEEWIRRVVELSKKHFGKFIFLPGYDLELDKILLQSADVWLYSPELLLEACGTSNLAGKFNGDIPVASPTGWSRERLIPFDPNTGIGNGFYIENYPMPLGDWSDHIKGLKDVGWSGLYNPLKTISDLYYKHRQDYYQLVSNVYQSAPEGDMKIAAEKYDRLLKQSSIIIGTHTPPGKTIEEMLTRTDELNFRAFELSFYGSGVESPRDLDPVWVEDVLKPKLVGKFVTVHLPVPDIHEDNSLQKEKETIDFVADLGVRVVTDHLGKPDTTFIDRLVKLIEYAALKGVILGLENKFYVDKNRIVWHTPEHFNKVFEKVRSALIKKNKLALLDNLGIVFDLAHAKAVTTPLEYYHRLRKDFPIVEVNAHGNELFSSGDIIERHVAINNDKVIAEQLPAIIKALLEERDFKGPYIIEMVDDNLFHERNILLNIYSKLFIKQNNLNAHIDDISKKRDAIDLHLASQAIERAI